MIERQKKLNDKEAKRKMGVAQCPKFGIVVANKTRELQESVLNQGDRLCHRPSITEIC